MDLVVLPLIFLPTIAQKMKFCIKNISSKYNQIRSFLGFGYIY